MATVTDGRNGLVATVTDGRVMPDIYGYGQLFAFSGLDGQTSFSRRLCRHAHRKAHRNKVRAE